MQTFKLENFVKGWFCGSFEPALFRNKEVEVAYQSHKKNYVGPPHFHAIATEYNFIIDGVVTLYNQKDNLVTTLGKHSGWEVKPGEYYHTMFLEDTQLIVIKTPSVPGDWYSC